MKWVSWFQPTNDYRPLTYPPNDKILGWWCTGYNSNDEAVIVAFVNSDNDGEAWKAVKKDWPEYRERFINDKNDFKIGTRFPLEDWMKERIEKLK